MLKSLGQWKSASLKPRKIILSQLTAALPKPPSSDKEHEKSGMQEENEYVGKKMLPLKRTFKNINAKILMSTNVL